MISKRKKKHGKVGRKLDRGVLNEAAHFCHSAQNEVLKFCSECVQIDLPQQVTSHNGNSKHCKKKEFTCCSLHIQIVPGVCRWTVLTRRRATASLSSSDALSLRSAAWRTSDATSLPFQSSPWVSMQCFLKDCEKWDSLAFVRFFSNALLPVRNHLHVVTLEGAEWRNFAEMGLFLLFQECKTCCNEDYCNEPVAFNTTAALLFSYEYFASSSAGITATLPVMVWSLIGPIFMVLRRWRQHRGTNRWIVWNFSAGKNVLFVCLFRFVKGILCLYRPYCDNKFFQNKFFNILARKKVLSSGVEIYSATYSWLVCVRPKCLTCGANFSLHYAVERLELGLVQDPKKKKKGQKLERFLLKMAGLETAGDTQVDSEVHIKIESTGTGRDLAKGVLSTFSVVVAAKDPPTPTPLNGHTMIWVYIHRVWIWLPHEWKHSTKQRKIINQIHVVNLWNPLPTSTKLAGGLNVFKIQDTFIYIALFSPQERLQMRFTSI